MTTRQLERLVITVLAWLLAGRLPHQGPVRPRLEQVRELLPRGERSPADDHEKPIRSIQRRASQDLLNGVTVQGAVPALVLADIENEPCGRSGVGQGEDGIPLRPVRRRSGYGHDGPRTYVERPTGGGGPPPQQHGVGLLPQRVPRPPPRPSIPHH